MATRLQARGPYSMNGAKKLRVLYIVYWGALEPLGQSLVVPAVQRLAEMGLDITLITFEKAGDLSNREAVGQLKAAFDQTGVHWNPLRYHKTPKWPATAYDALAAVFTALRLRVRRPFDVVHARTFVAGPMGYLIARLLGAPFVYHNEGFYPDEQVDGGVWRRGSVAHRLAKSLEGFLYDHADGIVVLSERARTTLRGRPRVPSANIPIIVVPSAVDLDAFRPPPERRIRSREVSLVYLGSVGLRYRLDDAGRFVAALRRLEPQAVLTVVSRADRRLVETMLETARLPRNAWTHKELAHADVPEELQRHDAGLFFLTVGLSEEGCSPTKVGEYWACGLPVVTTPNVSDTDGIVRSQRVGVVVDDRSEAALETAAQELLQLLGDEGLGGRCRQAAEAAYSIETSCRHLANLYSGLAS